MIAFRQTLASALILAVASALGAQENCASFSEDGRWAEADNWHGDITIFEGKTTRPRLLTTGHRIYGHGEHPHVSWDRDGKQVVFTSHLLGDPNVCIASIPEA